MLCCLKYFHEVKYRLPHMTRGTLPETMKGSHPVGGVGWGSKVLKISDQDKMKHGFAQENEARCQMRPQEHFGLV